jgi:hypothetical protein
VRLSEKITTSDKDYYRALYNVKGVMAAYTNCDVDTLNAELRQVRRERGELARPKHQGHSTQSNPLAVREVRRILLDQLGNPATVHRDDSPRAHSLAR